MPGSDMVLAFFSFQSQDLQCTRYFIAAIYLKYVRGLFEHMYRASFIIFHYEQQIHNSWFQTFAVFWVLCVIFWVFPRRLIIECRRFGTLYLFHLQRLDMKWPLKMEQIKCSETSAFNNQTPGKYPKDYTQMHNYFANHHTPTCFDTIVSSSGSL